MSHGVSKFAILLLELMESMKEQLIQLINSFAAARTSNDPILVQFASQQLTNFLEKVTISEQQTDSYPENEETEI